MIPGQQPPDVHAMVEQLTRTHVHREPVTRRRGSEVWSSRHITTVPALVRQLLGASPASQATESTSGGFSSRPAARIEALDTVMLIDDEAARWLRKLGHDDPGDRRDDAGRHDPGSGTIACIQLLHGLAAGLDACDRHHGRRDDSNTWCCLPHHIEHDVRRWWHQARVITGWDTAAYRPFNTCPVCEQRGSLRINLAMHAGLCVECRTVWSSEDIGLLAEHIRTENLEEIDESADVGDCAS